MIISLLFTSHIIVVAASFTCVGEIIILQLIYLFIIAYFALAGVCLKERMILAYHMETTRHTRH